MEDAIVVLGIYFDDNSNNVEQTSLTDASTVAESKNDDQSVAAIAFFLLHRAFNNISKLQLTNG